MRYLKVLAVLAAAVLSTGCLRLTYTLNVKPDGSGTVSTTFAVASSMMQQVGMLMGASGSPLPTEAQMRQAAKGMGPATRFIRATPYKTGGFEGTTALYAFDDLNKLTLNLEQAIAGTINAPQMMGGQIDPASEVKLSFTRQGDRTIVVLGMPDIPEPTAELKEQAGAAVPPPSSPEADAMMKQMLGGLLLEVGLDVTGKIVKTNAPYVEGSKIVLLRLDGNTLIKSGAGLGALMQLGTGTGDIQERLRKVPGLKVVTLKEVRVEFR